MKYLLSILFVVVSFTFVSSQNILDYKEYYIGTGYGAGFAKFGKLNSILDKYDDANTQEKEFKDFRSPNGISFLAGTTQSFINIELGFTQLQQRRKSKFNEGDDLMQKDARLRINSYNLGLGVFFPVESNFGFGFNASADYYRMKLSTREAVEKSINRSSFVTPVKGTSYGTTISAKFYFGQMEHHGTKLMIVPFYSIVFDKFDGGEFDNYINGDGSSDSTDSKQNMSHFGIKFIVNYSIVR